MKIGFQAIRIALAGFIVPYMAVYDPALMLQGERPGGTRLHRRQGAGRDRTVGRGEVGYWLAPVNWFERVVCRSSRLRCWWSRFR